VRGINLKLDVYRPRSQPKNCPVLFEIHGGGWIVGSKNEQGIPMMLRMAAQAGCASAPTTPVAACHVPEHLLDLKKRSLDRAHIAEYGGNPESSS